MKLVVHYSLPLFNNENIDGIFGINLLANEHIDLFSNFDFENKLPYLEIYFNKKGYLNFFSFSNLKTKFIEID